jgi:putative endonuclease
MTRWYVYIVKCVDGTLYTGVTTDVERRIHDHQQGMGAKYTRGRTPLSVIHRELHKNRSEAQIREAEIKNLSHNKKLELTRHPSHAPQEISKRA